MNDLINIAVVVVMLFGGTVTAEKIYVEVRKVALAKVAQGLPRLSSYTVQLTNRSKQVADKKFKR